MKQLKLLTVISQDINPIFHTVFKSKVLYTACYEETSKPEAFIIVDKNKIILNDTAFDEVGRRVGNRFDVVYKQIDTQLIPCLVNKTMLGQGGGKLLRKNHTFSFTGDAYDELVKYGMFFRFLQCNDDETEFILIPAENLNRHGIIGAHIEGGSDFDLDENTTDQNTYESDFVVNDNRKEYTKEEDIDDILKNMFD